MRMILAAALTLMAMFVEAQPMSREMLTAVRTYYVRTDGNDANDGLTNNAAGALATVQAAIGKVYSIDLGNYGAIIQVGNGTYTPPQYSAVASLWAPFVGGNPLNTPANMGSAVTIRGDPTTPSNVVFDATDGSAVRASYGANINIEGVRFVIRNSGTALYASAFGQITISGAVDFGPCAGTHMNANQNGKIIVGRNYYLSGNAYAHGAAIGGGSIESNVTVFVSGGLSMSRAFAEASTGGVNSMVNTYTNYSVSGKTYDATYNGIVDTGGNGVPGSVGGTTSTGGLYR